MPGGGRNKVQAWDTDSHSEDSDLLTYDEDLDDVGRSKLLHGACQLVLAGQAVALALFAGHTDGAEHAVFYVCDAFVVLLFLVYSVLRCLGHLGPTSMAPVCAVFTWALSLLLSLSAPGRRRRLLGLEESGSADHCEEGSAALWIALLLSLCPVLVQMPSVPFFLLGQLVSVQHLIIGLILPRPECSRDAGGPGGAMLGLPPIWVSSLQLSLLAALLVGGHWHLERRRQAERVIARFLDTRSIHRRDDAGTSPQLAQNRLERIVNELEKEEKDCRRLVRELDDVMPPSYSSDRLWASLPLHVAGLLKHYSGQLKRHTVDGDNATDQLFRAMERGQERGETAVVSGWLEQSWGGPQGHTRQRRSSIARSEPVNLAAVGEEDGGGGRLERSTTIVGLAVEWGIGEWEFDALKCEQDHRHVLQTVGFELLRGYSILPREPLGAFLELLERTYMAGNPYHSHVHGADMTNALFYLINKTELWDLAEIADSTRAATIVAALGHDVGHFARNNTFLISSRHALAITYNDRSILENFHSATLMKLLDTVIGESEEKRTKLFSGFPADHLQKARNLMITLILGTDPAKHLDDLSAFRLRLGSTSFDPASDDNDQQTCLLMLFRAADIGHSAKDWHLHQEWSRRVVQEFHAQGDQEKSMGLKVSPLCEREGFQLPSSQVGFLQFICLPTWTELANLEGRIKEMSQMVFPSRHSARKSTISSNGRKSPTCASPRESAPTPSLQRRGSIGHAIGMLTGGARSAPFLALPGAMPPGTPSNKVVPAVPEELVPAQNRCVRDVCLGNCDRNCQQWKAMAKTSMTTESFPNSTFDAERTALSTPEPEAQVEGPSPRGDEEGAP